MTGIILQARMGSTRLPGKVMAMIGDKPLIGWIFYRMSFLKNGARLVVATTVKPEDDAIAGFCEKNGVDCFRGSEENVLERYYMCAKKYGFFDIVRLTADNPFVDVEELDRLVKLHKRTRSEYTHSFGELPVGAGAEIFTFEALEKSYRYATKMNHFEHVNEYIQENPGLFKITALPVSPDKKRPDMRLTVDTEEDLGRVRFIAENAGDDYITTELAIKLCSRFV